MWPHIYNVNQMYIQHTLGAAGWAHSNEGDKMSTLIELTVQYEKQTSNE